MSAATYGLRRAVQKARNAHRTVLLYRRLGLASYAGCWTAQGMRRDALVEAREFKRRAVGAAR